MGACRYALLRRYFDLRRPVSLQMIQPSRRNEERLTVTYYNTQ